MKFRRFTHPDRKLQIEEAGVQIAQNEGLHAVGASSIARRIGLVHSAVMYYYKDAGGLLAAVVSRAVAEGNDKVIAFAVASGHPVALALPRDRRAAALQSLA